MKQQHIALPQCLNEMLRALDRKANEIDDDVGAEIRDAFAENAGCLLCRAIDPDSLDLTPRGVGLIRLPCSATGDDYLVPRDDESRNEIGADVTGAANDDDSDSRTGWG
jgi:hypothetical protein